MKGTSILQELCVSYDSTTTSLFLEALLACDAVTEDLLKAQNNRGETILHTACYYGYTSLLTLLLNSGKVSKNVLEIQDNEGNTALYLYRSDKPEILKMLLAYEEVTPELLQKQNNKGRTVLHEACYLLNAGYLKHLLDSGKVMEAVLKVKCHNGCTAIHQAFPSNNIDLFKEFLACDQLTEDLLLMQDDRGWTGLHEIAASGDRYLAFLDTFLDSRWVTQQFLAVQDIKGNTALHLAISVNSFDYDKTAAFCKRLLSSKNITPEMLQVILHLKNNKNKTVIDLVSESGDKKIIDLFLNSDKIAEQDKEKLRLAPLDA